MAEGLGIDMAAEGKAVVVEDQDAEGKAVAVEDQDERRCMAEEGNRKVGVEVEVEAPVFGVHDHQGTDADRKDRVHSSSHIRHGQEPSQGEAQEKGEENPGIPIAVSHARIPTRIGDDEERERVVALHTIEGEKGPNGPRWANEASRKMRVLKRQSTMDVAPPCV